MASNDFLHQLIHSLSRTEKKYFKDSSGQDSAYVKLFDAINDLEEYDEEKILKKYKRETWVKNIAVAKNYLTEALMRTLRQYHSGKVPDDIAYERLQNIRLLFERGMIAQVEKRLKQLYEYCSDNQLYPILLLLLNFEMTLNNSKTRSNKNIFSEKERILSILQNCNELNKIYEQLLDLTTQFDFQLSDDSKKNIDELMNSPLLRDEKQFTTSDERYAYWNCFFVYHYLMQDYRSSYLAKMNCFKLCENDKAFIQNKPKTFLLMMGNIASMANNIKDTAEFLKCYELMLETHEKVKGFDALKFEQRAAFGLVLYKLLPEHNGSEELAAYIEENLPKYKHELSLVRELDIYLNLSLYYLRKKDFNRSLEWIERILSHPRIDERNIVHRYALLQELVLHFELGNIRLLEYKQVNTYRHLHAHHKLDAIDKAVLGGIGKLIKAPDKKALKTAIEKMIASLREVPEEEYQKAVYDHFDYLHWLEEKRDCL